MAHQPTAVRACPVCGEEKEFPRRNEACSNACGQELRRRRLAGAVPTETVKLRLELADLRRRLQDSVTKTVRNETYERFVAQIAERPLLAAPPWTAAQPKVGERLVVPTAFLSDTHFDERVDPLQINGVNEYSRAIAEVRLKRFFDGAVRLGKRYFSGLTYPGVVLALGGDIFSGNIHEELRHTNECSMADSILHWLPLLGSGVRQLADEYGKVYIPAVVGNHGRNTFKPINKGRVRDNFDWLIYQLLARELAGDKRVTFAISEAPDITYTVFQTRYCLTHGDQFRGGSGISGLLSPLMIGDHRKRRRAQAVQMPYDYLLMGHWHQFSQYSGTVVNGSLKGYDEYAFNNNFSYEPPQQAFWLTSREYQRIWGVSPIHVEPAVKVGKCAAFEVSAA